MKRNGISLRAKFLIGYIGITAFACLMIGFLLMLQFNAQIKASAAQDYREKLALAANDMDTQQDILLNISHRIKTSPQYRPFFTSRNAYYERDIIEDIAKYENYSPIVSEYYILLSHSASVYSKMGKLSVDHFIKYKMGVWDGSISAHTMLASPDFQIIPHPAQSHVSLAIVPMRIMTGINTNTPDACLIFWIDHTDLLQRIERISGLTEASIRSLSILYRGELMAGQSALPATAVIGAVSDTYGYTLTSSADIDQVYPRIPAFRAYYILLLTALTIALSSLAGFLARRSYRPINRIIGTLKITPDSSAEDIAKAVKTLQEGHLYSGEHLQRELQKIAEQRREIAKQLLFAKLNPMQDEKMDALMAEAGIAMEHPLFSVMIARFDRGNVAESSIATLASALSDDDISVFSAGLYQPGCFLLLLNFSARGQEEEISAIILESLELEGLCVEMQVGDTCDDVSQLHLSLISALTKKAPGTSKPASAHAAHMQDNWYDDRGVIQLIEALREGNILKANTALSELSDTIKDQYPSVLFQRSICADIINHLMKLLRDLDIPLDNKDLYGLLAAYDIEAFEQSFSNGLLEEICGIALNRKNEISDEKEQMVTTYIRENLFSPDFTIFQAADHFGLSDRKIGSIVRHVTGKSYKDFIIDLRIKHAKDLLTRDKLTVSQTGSIVGYNNIPYFIKLFRNHTGYTPGEYKKKFES